MKVADILQSKGADVFSVSDSATIADAVGVLGDKNIGAVVVKDGTGKLVGILSERDIVRRLCKDGASVLGAAVKTCMTSSVLTCALDETIDQVMVKMTERRIRHMPVIRDNALVGMVSIGDVVKRKIENAEQEAAALREYITS